MAWKHGGFLFALGRVILPQQDCGDELALPYSPQRRSCWWQHPPLWGLGTTSLLPRLMNLNLLPALHMAVVRIKAAEGHH